MPDLKVTVNAGTELYAVLGNPVRHSLSPYLHNTLFTGLGINAVYLALEVEPNSLALAFEGIRSMGIRGVNLTIPFKEDAMNYIDEVPEDIDRAIGAINTVVNREGRLFGYNTDAPGFLSALEHELSFRPAGKTALVLGAGGAARGIAFALAHAGADRVLIYNRTADRAHGLAGHLSAHFPETEIEVLHAPEDLEDKLDLVVNATAVGLKSGDGLPLDLTKVPGAPAIYDLIYAPAETPLLKQARARKLAAANGLGMLAEQAAMAFALWTGRTDGIREGMLEALKKCAR